MSKSTILIVDDEKAIHIFLKAMLAKEYNLEFVLNAQQAIDILAVKPINLILLDIQMPELSGLELLQSLTIDISLNKIPIIIISGNETEERRKSAKKLGAAGFISKDFLLDQEGRNYFKNLIKKNLKEVSSSVTIETNYKAICSMIIRSVIIDAQKHGFFHSANKMGLKLMKHFDIDYISFWAIQNNLLISLGDKQPENFGIEEIKSEQAFKELNNSKKPYLTNNAASKKKGIFSSFAMKSGMSSEIGVPLFKISRRDFVNNKMHIPKDTPVYGLIFLKRNKVFSTKEFEILSKSITCCGTILWALYQDLFSV
ncbi:hypothetical protein BH23BAC3_BH23BAC3_10240 [soil metagenome]